jgi:hypothetical protein
MSLKLHTQQIIKQQKIIARKSIAALEIKLGTCDLNERLNIIKLIANEKSFLSLELKDIENIDDLLKIIHATKHYGLSKTSNHTNCLYCKKVLSEMAIEMPGAPAEHESVPSNEDNLKPRFGNLIAVLKQEVLDELNRMERLRLPSQNDLTRWALKDAVLAFYQRLNIPEDVVVVDTLYDDRLITKLAPDFDVIADIWMEKLDELQRRNDKYTLESEEYDKADVDFEEGMRGSAFEKQLDRYREEFMQKLKR